MGKLAHLRSFVAFLLFIPLAACTVDLAAGNLHFFVDPTTTKDVPSELPAG